MIADVCVLQTLDKCCMLFSVRVLISVGFRDHTHSYDVYFRIIYQVVCVCIYILVVVATLIACEQSLDLI